VSCCCEKLVAETRASSGSQRKMNVHGWKPLPSNGSEDLTVDNTVCVYVTVTCKAKSRVVYQMVQTQFKPRIESLYHVTTQPSKMLSGFPPLTRSSRHLIEARHIHVTGSCIHLFFFNHVSKSCYFYTQRTSS
jgi:hypothetical protein